VFFHRFVFGCVATCVAAAAIAQASAHPTWTLAAVAADVDAAVFSDENGALRKIAVGDTAPGDVWRLVSIREGRAMFRALTRRDGHPISLELSIGESLTPPPAGAQQDRR
jgi:hypothetical protein